MWRRVPPVHSPVRPRALLAAAVSAVGIVPATHRRMEEELARSYGASDALLLDSGTSALMLALRMIIPAGGLVAMPAYACIDIVAAAIGARVQVLFYDVDPGTLAPDLDSVSSTLDRGATALVVASLYGYPADMKTIAELASSRRIPLIEDAAQAAGGVFLGKPLGSFGDLSLLSFSRGKGITAGAGGALLVRNERFGARVAAARSTLARARGSARQMVALAAQSLLSRPALYAVPAAIPALRLGEMVYRPPREPARATKITAALLESGLAHAESELRIRRRRAAIFTRAVGTTERLSPLRVLPGAEPGFLRFALVDRAGSTGLDARLGALRGYPVALVDHPEAQRLLGRMQPAVPGARYLSERLVTLPTHSRVSEGDVGRIVDWLRRSSERHAEGV
jgi:dTDP-4-amino-4,6-dideoxygalactose transaminase